MWMPYVGFGVGIARVQTISTFILNGTDITDQLENTYGISLGQDLTDSTTKAFIVVPVGVQAHFLKRLVVDGSYRYGRIAARTSEIPEDIAINTQRVQVGIGVRFGNW
jgi:opacity protein-like surface antigen